MSSIRTLRVVAILEATAFLALLVATYVRYAHDAPLGVHILGPIHGVLFIAYVLVVIAVRPHQGWTHWTLAVVLLGAIVPFGGYVVDRWLARQSFADPG